MCSYGAMGSQDIHTPLPAEPDDKDWTWVLEKPCPECGADVGGLSLEEVAELNLRCAQGFVEVLAGDPAAVRIRPHPATWSPLEYGCHVRDVFKLFGKRLEMMLTADDPLFPNWDPNVTAIEDRYDLADPAEVAEEMLGAAEELAARFRSLTAEQRERPGRRSDGASFTVLTFARYEIHDPIHHLWDVTGERN